MTISNFCPEFDVPSLFIFFLSNFAESWKKVIRQVPKKCAKLPHPPFHCCPRLLILLTTLFCVRGKNFLLSGYIFSTIVVLKFCTKQGVPRTTKSCCWTVQLYKSCSL